MMATREHLVLAAQVIDIKTFFFYLFSELFFCDICTDNLTVRLPFIFKDFIMETFCSSVGFLVRKEVLQSSQFRLA